MIDAKHRLKRGLINSRFLTWARRWQGPRAIILRYHSVCDDPEAHADSIGRGITHSTSAFRQHMEWVAGNSEPMTLDDLAAAVRGERPMPRQGVVVTFDDGYADNFNVALPILDRLGIPAAFYIMTDCLTSGRLPWFCRLRHAFAETPRAAWQLPGQDRVFDLEDPGERRQAFSATSACCARIAGAVQAELIASIERALEVEPLGRSGGLHPPLAMMSWEQLRELRRRGHTVGAHSVTHPNLAQIAPEEAAREMGQSRKCLEENLGEPVPHFSYPSPILQPHWNNQTVASCREAGYQTAVTCTAGAVFKSAAPLSLCRIPAPEDLDEFKWAVECAFLGRYV